MYKIEKNIPIPESIHGGGPYQKYPLDKMEIGDSFLINCSKEKIKSIRSSLSQAVRRAKKIGMKFTTKFTDNGLRVWRIH